MLSDLLAVLEQVGRDNLIALVWFLLCMNGYTRFAKLKARTTPCLANVMHQYRLDWMRRLLARENRVADTSAISNLERSVSFFASSTLIILAGLLTLFGASEQTLVLIRELPVVTPSTVLELEVKLLVMSGLFVYAFFKFTWSLRQYGFASVLIGSAPMFDEAFSEAEGNAFVQRSARIITMAANNFNFGLRSYYFGLSLLGWMISPWVLIGLSTGVVYVLYQREFRSSTLKTLMVSLPEEDIVGSGYRQLFK